VATKLAITSHHMAKKKATVPTESVTIMTITAVHAAGEWPWPGSVVVFMMLLANS
jgi:hypothetical protein